jgi:hypothetical protein
MYQSNPGRALAITIAHGIATTATRITAVALQAVAGTVNIAARILTPKPMCDPVTIGLAIVSAAAQYDMQRKAANAQADAVNKAATQEQMNLAIQQGQQGEAAAQQVNEHARAAQRDAATMAAISGEYGGGNTTDRLATVQGIQQDERLATIQRNVQFEAQNSSLASMSIESNKNARLASIQQPSKVAAALQIGGAMATSYAKYTANQTPKAPAPVKVDKVVE